MRASETIVTGYTLAFPCCGRGLHNFWEPVQAKGNKEPSATAGHAFTAELTQCLKDVVNFARKHQDAARSAQGRHCSTNRGTTILSEGDLMLWEAHTLSDASKDITAKLALTEQNPFV